MNEKMSQCGSFIVSQMIVLWWICVAKRLSGTESIKWTTLCDFGSYTKIEQPSTIPWRSKIKTICSFVIKCWLHAAETRSRQQLGSMRTSDIYNVCLFILFMLSKSLLWTVSPTPFFCMDGCEWLSSLLSFSLYVYVWMWWTGTLSRTLVSSLLQNPSIWCLSSEALLCPDKAFCYIHSVSFLSCRSFLCIWINRQI